MQKAVGIRKSNFCMEKCQPKTLFVTSSSVLHIRHFFILVQKCMIQTYVYILFVHETINRYERFFLMLILGTPTYTYLGDCNEIQTTIVRIEVSSA